MHSKRSGNKELFHIVLIFYSYCPLGFHPCNNTRGIDKWSGKCMCGGYEISFLYEMSSMSTWKLLELYMKSFLYLN